MCAVLVGGCAQAPLLPDAPRTEVPAEPASRWSGRFTVDHERRDATPLREAGGGRFLLQREAGRLELELMSPLGQTQLRARSGPEGATVTLADGGSRQAADAETLTEAILGWRLPLGRLDAWLDGRVATQARRDASGRLLQASEGGWRIEVDDWLTDGRPRRLRLTWPDIDEASASRVVRLRLALDSSD